MKSKLFFLLCTLAVVLAGDVWLLFDNQTPFAAQFQKQHWNHKWGKFETEVENTVPGRSQMKILKVKGNGAGVEFTLNYTLLLGDMDNSNKQKSRGSFSLYVECTSVSWNSNQIVFNGTNFQIVGVKNQNYYSEMGFSVKDSLSSATGCEYFTEGWTNNPSLWQSYGSLCILIRISTTLNPVNGNSLLDNAEPGSYQKATLENIQNCYFQDPFQFRGSLALDGFTDEYNSFGWVTNSVSEWIRAPRSLEEVTQIINLAGNFEKCKCDDDRTELVFFCQREKLSSTLR